MMIFGRSLFGGATSGQVLAVGFAAALVSAVAVPEVTRLAHSNGQAQSVTQGKALKSHVPAASTAAAAAIAHGKALVDFQGYALAPALAYGAGKGTADFMLAGDGHATFLYQAIVSKRTRAPRALAWGFASGEAEGQVYEYVYGKTAIARATALGTTYHVGRTDGRPTATGSARFSLIAGAQSKAKAIAEVTGECRRAGGAAGHGQAPAKALVDASVTRGNVREYELVGIGACSATAEVANVAVYQLQHTRSYAYGSKAVPSLTRGVKGAARATCSARGIALGTSTAASPKTGNSVTVAVAKASYRLGVKGRAVASAKATGKGTGRIHRSSAATALASASYPVIELSLTAVNAGATGSGAAQCLRILTAFSQAYASIQATGFMQVNDLSKAPLDRTVILDFEDRLVAVEPEPRLILI